jgi:RNA polymerase sigma-70 factor (ECF subfamily)
MTAPVSAVDAFEAAMLQFLPDVARYARVLTRDAADGDDLVQETYLRAYRSRSTFIAGSDARRWLFTICRNTYLRGREREDRYVSFPESPEADTLFAVRAHAAAVRDGSLPSFDAPDVGPAIAAALAALPPLFAEVVAMIDIAGYSYAEVAEHVGVPVGTVRSRLFRARRILQEQLLAHARDMGFARTPLSRREET